jgi:hypothetical protein
MVFGDSHSIKFFRFFAENDIMSLVGNDITVVFNL